MVSYLKRYCYDIGIIILSLSMVLFVVGMLYLIDFYPISFGEQSLSYSLASYSIIIAYVVLALNLIAFLFKARSGRALNKEKQANLILNRIKLVYNPSIEILSSILNDNKDRINKDICDRLSENRFIVSLKEQEEIIGLINTINITALSLNDKEKFEKLKSDFEVRKIKSENEYQKLLLEYQIYLMDL